MTEKRFKLSKYVTPSSLSNFCDENGRMLNKEVVKVLNEQQATINELQSIIYDYCCETVYSLYNEIKHLKEENEQLRQILKDIVVATDETYTKNRSIYKVSVIFDTESYLKIRECLNE